MMKPILLVLCALIGACAQPQQAGDCICTFNGKTYVIKQNAKGAVYGVPAKETP